MFETFSILGFFLSLTIVPVLFILCIVFALTGFNLALNISLCTLVGWIIVLTIAMISCYNS